MSNTVLSSAWLFLLLVYGGDSLSHSTKQGFNDKFMSTRQHLTNTIYQNSKDYNNMKINTSMIWSRESIIQQSSSIVPTILRTNNYTIMLDNMDLFVFKENDFQYNISLLNSFNYDVQFVKGFHWQDKLYLLICFQNSVCSLYSVTSDFGITYHQSISDNGDPADAQFFIQQGKLYLTILFHEHSFSLRFNRTSSQLRIYQWHNLYMDPELIPDIISSATCIAVFGYEEDIILVLGCPGDESFKFPSQVWCRKRNGDISQVQYLPTDRPTSIHHFIERGENFILILEKYRETSIYWWEGSEFVQWLSVGGLEKYFQVAEICKLNHTTLLTLINNNVLRIYLMTSMNLNKIYETEFSNREMKVKISRVAIFEENDITYMFVLTTHNGVVYESLYKMDIHIFGTIAHEVPGREAYVRDTAQGSLNTIYQAVMSLKFKMENLNSLASSVLLTNRNTTIRHAIITGEVDIKSGEIEEILHRQKDIAQYIGDLHNYISPISQQINSIWHHLHTTFIAENRHLIFHSNVYVKNAKINSLDAKIINGNIFEPQSFLSVTNVNQRLKNINTKKLKVDWLVIKKIGDKNAEDFHLAHSRVNVPITVEGLETTNLRISENITINNISARDIANKMVNLDLEADDFNEIYQIGAGKRLLKRPKVLKLQDNTVIYNLDVDFIDDVAVNNLLTSVFVKEVNSIVKGDIHFQAGVKTKEIAARKFNFPTRKVGQNPPPSVPMNMQPPQMNIFPPQMNFPPSQSNILPPQIIYPQLQPQMPLNRPSLLPVVGYPQNWVPFNPFVLNGRRMKREEFEDFEDNEIPIRKMKIKILGNLKVGRLLFRNSSLVVNSHFVPTTNLEKTLWTYTSSQEINGSVHFTEGISIEGSLNSPTVNGKNLTCFASRKSNLSFLIFKDVYVDGSVSTKDNTSFQISGNKFQESGFKFLTVKHLRTKKINGEEIHSILQTKDLLQGGIKIFTEKLNVNGNLEANLINEINVNQKLKSAIMIDTSFELNNVKFKTISGENMNVKNLNNQSLELMASWKNSSVYIKENLHLPAYLKVSLINSQPAQFSQVVNKQKGAVIYGKKKFYAQVTVDEEFRVTSINNFNFENWSKKLLRVSQPQEVTGLYTMKHAEMKSTFNASLINGIYLSNLLYINEPDINLPRDIRFKSIEVDENFNSKSIHKTCQLPKVEDSIVFEQDSKWSRVVIMGDSDWPRMEGGQLQHVFESAVTAHGDQLITGNITIRLLSVPNIRVQLLNDKNISFIFQDSLLKQKKNQVISGKKTFKRPFKCKNIEVIGDAQVRYVNNVNIKNADLSLVRRSGNGMETITGQKTFLKGFKAFYFDCPEGINGIKAEDIVSRKSKVEAPPFTVKSLKVLDSLHVQTVNDLNLNKFLKNCIYLGGTEKQRILGRLRIIGNVSLQGNVTTPSINHISINDVVFVKNKKPVKISDCKTFLSDLKIESDPNIHILNGKDLTEIYEDNVKIYQNVTLNGSLVIYSDVEVDNIFANEYSVGQKIIYLNQTLIP